MIISYSLKKEGKVKLSKNFEVSEFACPDGSDLVKVDNDGVPFLQRIRDYFGRPVYIGSGYRTPLYNKLIGGDPASDHMEGRAWDIDVGSNAQAIPARTVAMYAEAIGVKRIGLYMFADGRSWIHIGSWPTKLMWFDDSPTHRVRVETFLPVLRRQYIVFTNRYEVSVAQTILARLGFYKDVIDGKFGPNMYKAVYDFQAAYKISKDHVIGPQTWNKLFTV